MTRIYKYPIKITDHQTIICPKGINIIHVGLDGDNQPCVWGEIDDQAEKEDFDIWVIGTGHPHSNVPKKHVGSFIHQGYLIWHIYVKN